MRKFLSSWRLKVGGVRSKSAGHFFYRLIRHLSSRDYFLILPPQNHWITCRLDCGGSQFVALRRSFRSSIEMPVAFDATL